ncbi:gamma-aminobutyrate transaminase POP2 [Cucumis melo var. makuwa]|uniref:Gamma-aminobutyrate transaminase POP2 n=1 Tax=Cucumis melo var. makuwa TaxID=1194695 RepID=A0A5A7ST52_CUCMM|nr:gamma-aminobutyrate transaminase POP2 [Cucumis melo var. makuwa]TYJ98715.1 gamma-aminobutyrate transaminase POP2 [Cucumis melo var. makuwa]
MDEHIEDDTLCRTNVDPRIIERPLCIISLTTSLTMWTNTYPISSFPSSFDETDAIFLEFRKALDNPWEGTSQPSLTLTPKRRAQSRLLELELYVVANRQILMMIAPGTEKLFFHTLFVEHHMLNTFTEFQGDYHRHFENYSDFEEARANPSHLLNQMLELQFQPTVEATKSLSEMRYAGWCWVDDRATQKTFVGTQAQGSEDG